MNEPAYNFDLERAKFRLVAAQSLHDLWVRLFEVRRTWDELSQSEKHQVFLEIDELSILFDYGLGSWRRLLEERDAGILTDEELWHAYRLAKHRQATPFREANGSPA